MKMQPLDGKAINYSFIFWSLYYWVQERKQTKKNLMRRNFQRHRADAAFRSFLQPDRTLRVFRTATGPWISTSSNVFRSDVWPVWYKVSHDDTIKSTLLSTDYLTVIFIMKSTSQEDYDQQINMFPTSSNIIACQAIIVLFWTKMPPTHTLLVRNGCKIVLFYPDRWNLWPTLDQGSRDGDGRPGTEADAGRWRTRDGSFSSDTSASRTEADQGPIKYRPKRTEADEGRTLSVRLKDGGPVKISKKRTEADEGRIVFVRLKDGFGRKTVKTSKNRTQMTTQVTLNFETGWFLTAVKFDQAVKYT